MSVTAETITTTLRPIDSEGLTQFATKGRDNPEMRGTNKVHTVTEGQYRTISHVNGHEVVVDEPLHLMGEDTAQHRRNRFVGSRRMLVRRDHGSSHVEENKVNKARSEDGGGHGNSAAWGAGGAERLPEQMGFQEIRATVLVEGDATQEELDEIVERANYFSPVANSMRNPIAFSISREK